jgi:hypothetical protein
MIDLAFGTSWAQERKVFCGVRRVHPSTAHTPQTLNLKIESLNATTSKK